MIASQAASGKVRKGSFSNKKLLLLFDDNILGRMLNHLFSFTGFKTENRVSRGKLQFNLDDQDGFDAALIDLAHPSMMEELCLSCAGSKAEAFPKVILSTLPVNPGGCRGRSNSNCIFMGKPFKTRELIKKIDNFSGMTEEKIRRKIYQYYN